MKIKRALALLLNLALLTPTLQALVPKASAAAPTAAVAPSLTYATNPDAFVENVNLSQSGAWNLTMSADMKATGPVYAIIMKYSDFAKNYSTDSQIGTITASNYNALSGVSDTNYYRTQKTDVSAVANGVGMFSQSLYNFSSTVGENSATYHAKCALIIFDGATSVGALKDYTIGSFYVDSQGELQTESYMLRYMKNTYPIGTTAVGAMPPYQIEGWGTNATVVGTAQANNPTRLGYTFYGWHNTDKAMPSAPNDAAAASPAVDFPQNTGNTTLSWTTVNGGAYDKDKDKIYNLYAIWKPVQVKVNALSKTAGATNSDQEQTTKAKVGQTFEWKYETDGSWNNATKTQTGGNTQKEITAQYQQEGGAVQNGLPAGMGLATSKQESIMTYSALKVTPTDANQKPIFYLTGRPTEVSEKPITITLTVKDLSNNTTATITLKLTEIQKGNQALRPDEDVSTGLETDVVDVTVTLPPESDGADTAETTVKDGQILGLYSLGQKIPEPEGGHPNADGSGSLRDYYLTIGQGKWNQALLYEYRPHKEPVEGETDDPTEWREVPLPEAFYERLTTDSTPLDKAAVMESMKLKGGLSPKRVSSVYSINTTLAVKLVDETPVGGTDSEGNSVPWGGWPENYGYIAWDANGCPIIHGLTEGAKYDVRFKANADYGASESTVLTIGGRSGASGPPTTDGFYTVVFYDWDDTLLGSRIVADGGSLKGDSTATAGDRSNTDQTCAPLPPEYNEILDADGKGTGIFNKAGYEFAGWVDYETGHTTKPAKITDATGLTVDTAEIASLAAINSNLILKAAYNETSIGSTNATRRYTIQYSPFVKGGGGLQTTFTVSRKDVARRGNEGEMYLQLTLRTQAGVTSVVVPLGAQDVETFVLTMPTTASTTYLTNNAVSAIVYTALEGGKTENRSLAINIPAAEIIDH